MQLGAGDESTLSAMYGFVITGEAHCLGEGIYRDLNSKLIRLQMLQRQRLWTFWVLRLVVHMSFWSM